MTTPRETVGEVPCRHCNCASVVRRCTYHESEWNLAVARAVHDRIAYKALLTHDLNAIIAQVKADGEWLNP